MRIPLDYYRILSVPVKATTDQLKRAYSDRCLQQPRREYSQQAIEARQELIKYSYQVLSDSEQRTIYDAQFLLNMQPLETAKISEEERGEETAEILVEQEDEPLIPVANPTIEIPSGQIVGALLILHELGEYETVLTIGIDYFNSQEAELESTKNEVSLDTTQEDIILSLALAYLELGREQWHRREYEIAAISAQMGIDLLRQKNLFPHLREELEKDLDKLRPYRILELISQNPAESAPRSEGFKLLESMLHQRQGIEGKGEDRSGLNFDQFLCFIQQLRTYLNSAEQQRLFDNPSQSNSAIAGYLAVYALLGRGFSLKQPELILRAQRKLDSLSEQDVSWEQAISALLLGHTEKAIHKLRQAEDLSMIEQVERHTGSSDLLPGLCFYGEQWLKEDVQAQFSDLSATKLTLKEYFADQQVQNYLEELVFPPAPDTASTTSKKAGTAKSNTQSSQLEISANGLRSFWRNLFIEKPSLAEASSSSIASTQRELVGATIGPEKSATATVERNHSRTSAGKFKANHSSAIPRSKYDRGSAPKSLSLPLQPKTRAVPSSVIKKAQRQANRKRANRKKRSPATLWKGWLFIIGLALGVGTLANLAMKLILAPEQSQLAIALQQPAVELPPQKVKSAVTQPKPKPTFAEQSRQTIQTWLESKSAAFGKEHQIDRLNNILAEPLLTTWRERAIAYQQDNLYREFEHQVTMRSATIDPNNQNQATVEAEVKEVAKHYQSGQLNNTQSYDDDLLVRYHLVRKEDKWLINRTEVLN